MTFHLLICKIYLLACGLYCLLGIIIFRENPKRRINRVLGLLFFSVAAGFITGAFAFSAGDADGGAWQITFLGRFALLWEFFFPLLVYLSFIFPRESHLLSNNSRLVFILFIPYLFRFLLLAFFPDYEALRSLLIFELPEGLWGMLLRPPLFFLISIANFLEIFYHIHSSFFNFLNVIYIVIAFSQMSSSYTALRETSLRTRIRSVMWGIWLGAGIYLTTSLLPPLLQFPINSEICYTIIVIVILIAAGFIFHAIVKHKFLNIRFAAQKGLVFSLSTVFLIGSYLLIYGQTKQYLHDVLNTDLPVLELLFLVIAVYFFQPATDAIDSILNRVLNQNKNYHAAFNRFSNDILSTSDFGIIGDRILLALSACLGVHPVYLLLPNDKGIYAVHDAQDFEIKSVHFHRESHFIKSLDKFTQPVKFEALSKRAFEDKEKVALALLTPEMVVPVRHRGKLNGVLLVGSKSNQQEMTSQDMALLDLFALQISITIENTELSELVQSQKYLQQELSVARQIQRMLLPSKVPKGRTFRFASFNIPSKEVGGDYHDFIQLSDSMIGIAIGDIAGKGIPGSILMSNLQACLRAAALYTRSTSKVVSDVNRQLARSTTPDKYATFLYAIYHSDRRLRYCNAGHNYPIWRKQNRSCEPLMKSGPIIGVDDSITFTEFEIRVTPGDFIVFYTDGITEAMNANIEEYGQNRLMKVIEKYKGDTAEGLRDCIYDEVTDFTGGTRQYDDMTLIILQIV